MYIILVLFLARTLIYILTTPSPRFSVSKETVPSFFPRPRMSCCSFIAYSWSSMGMTALHRLLPLSMNISTNPLKFREIGLTIVPLKSLLFSIYELLLIAYKQSFFFLSAFPNCTYSSSSTTPICFVTASLVTPSKTNLFLLSTPVLLTDCIVLSNYFTVTLYIRLF